MASDLNSIIKLQQIAANGFLKIGVPNSGIESVTKLNKALDDTKHKADTGLLAMKALADDLSQSFNNTVNAIKNLASQAINVASDVESSRARLAFSAKKAGIDSIEQAKKLEAAGLKTNQTTKDLYDMASTLNMQKIDIFDKALDDLKVMDKTGKQVKTTSAEILADAASLSARGPGAFMAGIRGALGDGKIKRNIGLDAVLDLPEEFRTRYNKALAGASTQQEKFNALVRELGKDFGGTAAALGDTWKFMSNQVEDFRNKIYYELMKDVLPKMTGMMKDAGAYLTEFIEAGKLAPIRKEFNLIFAKIEGTVRALGRLVKKTIEFTSEHPRVLRYVAIFIGMGVAVKGVLMVLTKLGTTVQALRFSFEFIGGFISKLKSIGGLAGMLSKFKAFLLPFAPILLSIGAIAGAVALLARLLVKGKSWGDTWEKIQNVFEGIAEGITNMKNGVTTLSTDTALKLKRTGMFEFVYNFLRVANRIGKFVTGLLTGLEKRGPKIWENILRIGDAISRNLNVILNTFGVITNTDISGVADSGVSSWENFGEKVGLVIGVLVEKFLEVVAILAEVNAKILEILEAISKVTGAAKVMGYVLNPLGAGRDLLNYGNDVVSESSMVNKAMKMHQSGIKNSGAENSMKYNDAMAGGKQSVDIAELERVIGKSQSQTTTGTGGGMDYDKLTKSVVAGVRALPPPEVHMDGKKVTDKVSQRVTKERKLAQ